MKTKNFSTESETTMIYQASDTEAVSLKEKFKAPFPCIVCHGRLDNMLHPDSVPNQPLHACTFTSRGHYGSSVFDEIDGAKIEVNICDSCLRVAQGRGHVGYWPGYPQRKLVPWTGQ